MAGIDVLVEVDQVGALSKGGDGHVCAVIPAERRAAKWAEFATLFPDDSTPRRKVPTTSPLFAALMALPNPPSVYRNSQSGIRFAWATNRQYWTASLLPAGFVAPQAWSDVCDAWTPAKRDRALAHEKTGRLDLAFDEAIEQSGLAHVLGGDERDDKRRVDCWAWGAGEKKRFLALWVDGVKLADLAPVDGAKEGERIIPSVMLDVTKIGLDAKTLDEVRDPAFVFDPRRNYLLDWAETTTRVVAAAEEKAL